LGANGFIKGKAVLINPSAINTIEVPCRIACGKLHELKAHVKSGQVNLLEHLSLFIPKFGSSISLFTFQNGIQNTLEDFESMGYSIIEKIHEKTLCIGFYNETNGMIYGLGRDLGRLTNEWTLNAASVLIIRQLIATLAKVLTEINPSALWAHLAHSEVGLIFNEILTTNTYSLEDQYFNINQFLNNNLIVSTYGAVAPAPNRVRLASNTYSKDDIVMLFASKYLNNFPRPPTIDEKIREMAEISQKVLLARLSNSKEDFYNNMKATADRLYISSYPHVSTKHGCTVTIVESLVPKSEQLPIAGDHAFSGTTYQTHLKNNLDRFHKDFKIYVCK
jgi:hypothetical protein